MAEPSIAMIPSGYKAEKIYSVLPTNGNADLDFARTTTATRVNQNGLIEEMAIGVPRLDYTDGGCPSLLLEPASTNKITYSEDFSSLSAVANAVVTSNAIISPSGLLDADEITFDGTGAGRVEASIPVTIGQTYTISLYLKNKDLSNVTQVWVGFSGGSQGQYVTITNEWQRYDITTDADGTTEYPRIQFSGTGSLYAWGFQTEQRSFATSYIPTSGTTVTRVGETCVNATPEINSEEGTLYAEISGFTSNAFSNNSISITGASNDNRLYIYRSNTDNKYGFAVFSGGSLQCNIKTDVVDFSVNAKIAVKYKLNDFALYLNGTQVATDSGGSTPIGLNSLQFNGGLGNSPFYGNTKDLQYFNKALGDYQLAQLTTI